MTTYKPYETFRSKTCETMETIKTSTERTPLSRGQRTRQRSENVMMRPMPNHWTLRLQNDDGDGDDGDDDDILYVNQNYTFMLRARDTTVYAARNLNQIFADSLYYSSFLESDMFMFALVQLCAEHLRQYLLKHDYCIDV